MTLTRKKLEGNFVNRELITGTKGPFHSRIHSFSNLLYLFHSFNRRVIYAATPLLSSLFVGIHRCLMVSRLERLSRMPSLAPIQIAEKEAAEERCKESKPKPTRRR